MPASVIGGTLVLLVGPQVLGRAATAAGGPDRLADGLLPEAVLDAWSQLPVLLISVVFAALFIGKTIPGPLIAQLGPVPVLIGTAVLTVGWSVLGTRRFGPAREAAEVQRP